MRLLEPVRSEGNDPGGGRLSTLYPQAHDPRARADFLPVLARSAMCDSIFSPVESTI